MGLYTKLKELIKGEKIVSWPKQPAVREKVAETIDVAQGAGTPLPQHTMARVRQELSREIAWKLPNKDIDLKKINYFAVRDYERALFMDKGEIVGILDGGHYVLEKEAKKHGTEIVYTDIGEFEIPIGVGKSSGYLKTRDNYAVGLNGYMAVRIADPKMFIIQLVHGAQRFTGQDLKNSINSRLISRLEMVINQYKLQDLASTSPVALVRRFSDEISTDFEELGIKLTKIGPISFTYEESAAQIIDLKKARGLKEVIKVDSIETLYDKDDVAAVGSEIRIRERQRADQEAVVGSEIKMKELTRAEEVRRLERDQITTEAGFQQGQEEIGVLHKTEIARMTVEKTQYEAEQEVVKAEAASKAKKLAVEAEEHDKTLVAERELQKKKQDMALQMQMRKTEAEARAIEAQAGVDVKDLEVQKELAKRTASKLVIEGKGTPAPDQSRIKKLESKLEQVEEELKEIKTKTDTAYNDLTTKKITEAVYNTLIKSLEEDKKRMQKKHDQLEVEINEPRG